MSLRLIKEYVAEVLGNHPVIMIPSPPPVEYRIKELQKISHQYQNRRNPESMQKHLDQNMTGVFDKLLRVSGYGSSRNEIESMKEKIGPIITYHKKHFNQLRPAELAKRTGVKCSTDNLSSASSPSYPSGHATQAFYLAHKLSDMFPDIREELYGVANMVSESRVDRGVHFPSDIDAGKLLARKLYEMDTKKE